MKAFVLCAGKASRFRPFSQGLPKSSIPFLNLPLLAYSWFYLEQIGVDEMYLNMHTLPEILQKTACSLQKKSQKISFSMEEQPLGSAGGLFNNRAHFKEDFIYMNGDSLFFPSSMQVLKNFRTQKKSSNLFWTVPMEVQDNVAGFWVDKTSRLRVIGTKKTVQEKGYIIKNSKNLKSKELRPVQFVGLAKFNKEFLQQIQPEDFHIFFDVMIPKLEKIDFQVFIDEEGKLLEAGSREAYLHASEYCLQQIFSKTSFFKILQEIFCRFDPEDKIVGWKQGLKLGSKLKAHVLAPASVQGIDLIQVKKFAVLGKEIQFKGPSFLDSSVLGQGLSWQGDLKQDMIFDFSNY